MVQTVLPVLVSFHTPIWIKVALLSYRRHFPDDMVLVVDNNPDPGTPGWTHECDEERAWLRARPDILLIKNPDPWKGHGTGVDQAVKWCRENEIELMLHFEPDCLITGRRWFDHLLAAIDQGAWMAGSHRKHYGPIHPTPSLWRVREIRRTWEIQHRRDDLHHSRFSELFALDWLVQAIRQEGGPWEWWRDHWDTAQSAWFQAAIQDRATLVPETDDFRHFWCGSTTRHHPALSEDPGILEILRESASIPASSTDPIPREIAWPFDPMAHFLSSPTSHGDRRPRFCVVTPTIPGRERLLRAAIASVQAQDFQDLEHWVVGDGPCAEAESLCASLGVRYVSTRTREETWGTNGRNLVLEQANADYFVFLDDDNLLFRHSLARLHDKAASHGDPPLLAQKILFFPRGDGPWRVLPEVLPPQVGLWDQLCACVRGDIARQVRFVGQYTCDYIYIKECIVVAQSDLLLVDEIGGVHS